VNNKILVGKLIPVIDVGGWTYLYEFETPNNLSAYILVVKKNNIDLDLQSIKQKILSLKNQISKS
jgi:hypothetical protein